MGYWDQALKIAFDTSAFLTKNESVTDNEEYTVNLGVEEYITDGLLAYISVNWLRNEFRNYDNKFSIGAGMGRELFDDGQHSLKAKITVVGLNFVVAENINVIIEEEIRFDNFPPTGFDKTDTKSIVHAGYNF